MNAVRVFMLRHLWWLVLVVAVTLLIIHSFKVATITVDATSLVLLALILISPFVAAIKRIKIGDFEAEIEPEEVNKVAADAERSLAERVPAARPVAEQLEAVEVIRKLAETDNVVALAKLRIELESRLRKLHSRITSQPRRRQSLSAVSSLSHVIRDLTAAETLPFELGTALRGVVTIANRAIHGEDIRDVDAAKIIDAGTQLLQQLDSFIREYAVTHPIAVDVIPGDEVERAQSGRYRVTTIVPLVNQPERRVYEMTRDELDDFLDGYNEYAEFIVGIEQVG